MSDSWFAVDRLNPKLDRSKFRCGVPSLDRYFHEQAGQDSRRRIATVYTLVDIQESRIASYYTLSATSIKLAELPELETRKLPRYPVLPACLLGRLAVDERYQGQGLGHRLLIDALRRSVELSTELGIVAIAVDGKAALFYQRFDFQPLSDATNSRLYLSITKAQQVING